MLQLGTILNFIETFEMYTFYIDNFFNIFNIIPLNYVQISYFSRILNTRGHLKINLFIFSKIYSKNFGQKFARKALFPWEYYRLGYKPDFPISSDCLSVAKSEKFCILKRMTKIWTCRRKLRSSTQQKYYKTFYQFQSLFYTNSQVLLFNLSF
jgi:hypothetical protein